MTSSSVAATAITISLAITGCSVEESSVEEPVTAAPDRRPNILLIVADDMGFSDLGSFGGEIPTPNLDALANAGVRLANFHAAPVCAPTRAMLMSGMDNHEAGMGSMIIKRAFDGGRDAPREQPGYAHPGYEGYLSHRVAALPEVLRNAGYHTYMAGKWDLGRALVEEHNPAGRGFESSFALTTGSALHLEPADGGAHGGMTRADPLVFRENWNIVTELPPDYFSTATFTDKIIEYIGENAGDGKPFFAYLALSAPHWPLQVPEDWRDRFSDGYDEGYDVVRDRRVARALEIGVLPAEPEMGSYVRRSTPWASLDPTERELQARAMEIYAAMLANIDFHVGRLSDYLRDAGERDNTFIFFMSDNGADGSYRRAQGQGYDNSLENMGDNDSFIEYGLGWAEAAMAPFRDVKGAMAEGGVRAAAFANHGSLTNAGSVSQEYLTMQDVMPSLLEVAGVEHPGLVYKDRPVLPMRGKSFLGYLRGQDESVRSTGEAVGWELSGQRALVRDNWKLLRTRRAEGPTRWELFDLVTDPYERNDLSSQRPEITRELIDSWRSYADEVGVITDD